MFALVSSVICRELASDRNKDANRAAIVGFFFGIFAIAYYALVPNEKKLPGLLALAHGLKGWLEVYADTIIINHNTGRTIFSAVEEKTIPVSMIKSINFKSAGLISNGHIRFNLVEKTELTESALTVNFELLNQPQFDAAKDLIEFKLNELERPPQPAHNIDDIKRFADLKKKRRHYKGRS
ncbi:MAG: hypothetical protein Q8N81_01470 [bacterium]|nr:hypothetical protein [bacterium]